MSGLSVWALGFCSCCSCRERCCCRLSLGMRLRKGQRVVTLAFRYLSEALRPWGNLPNACTLLGMHVADPDSTFYCH